MPSLTTRRENWNGNITNGIYVKYVKENDPAWNILYMGGKMGFDSTTLH
jgi:hypothetical protein